MSAIRTRTVCLLLVGIIFMASGLKHMPAFCCGETAEPETISQVPTCCCPSKAPSEPETQPCSDDEPCSNACCDADSVDLVLLSPARFLIHELAENLSAEPTRFNAGLRDLADIPTGKIGPPPNVYKLPIHLRLQVLLR